MNNRKKHKLIRKGYGKEPTVIEFNLSKAVFIIIAIIIILSTITTVKIVKEIKKTKMDNTFAYEEVQNDNSIMRAESTSYITAYSNMVSLQDEGKTKINIVNLFDGQEVEIDDVEIEWIIESSDGGNVEIKQFENNLYAYGKSVGTVNIKARVTYNEITIESNTIELTIEEEFPLIYQKVTLFKYDAEKLFEIGGSVTDLDKQGIYFTNGAEGEYGIVGSSINLELSDWNYWHYETKENAYTGLVENELDSNGNIIFTKPAYGIVDETNKNGKAIYTNVGLPIKSLGEGMYQFKSSEMEVFFENGEPQNNVNLVMQNNKNSYIGYDVGYINYYEGFFPFNSVDGEDAIYHFGMHTQIPFYMTEDGKSDFDENEDILFEFSGDDDIWIFVDGKLVIDLGGIHDEIAADINFATGEIITYLGLKSTGQVERTDNLKEILGENWNNDIEKQHKLDIFYLERGTGGSNCSFSFNMPLEIPKSEVIVHHYIDGTTTKVAEDDVIEGNDGTLYRTNPSENIPPMYEIVTEKLPENAIGIIENGKIKEVIYYYKLKENSAIEKDGTAQITSLSQNIDYEIVYKSAIKNYVGKVNVKIVDKLPLKIDVNESELDNGIYDEETLTITWTGVYDTAEKILKWDNTNSVDNDDVEILEDGNIQITKDISLKYVDIPLDDNTKIENNIEGTLESEEGLKEIVEDTFETTTNFKTKVVVEKQWLGDTEQERPTEITIKLLVGETEQQEATLNKDNSWNYTFENLNKYNENREEIEYIIQENVPEGYYLYNSEKEDIEGGIKYTVTNFKYGEIMLTKVAQEDNSIKLSGAEFKLYKLIGDKSLGNELIDKNNVSSDWELVGTCITNDDGLIYFKDLEKISEYRLIETKASDGRLLSNGQWKIQFIYGDYDEKDKTIVNSNGTLVKITAIGNPPGIKIADDGSLLIPNSKYYDLPSSGSFGTNDFYNIGAIIITIGVVFLILSKLIVKKKR